MALAVLFCFGALAGCGASLRRFADRDPIWRDDGDFRAFGPRPREWYSPYVWDGVDNSAFRPLSEAFEFELSSEALNVNAMDEVPDSSWYENRLSRRAMSPDEVAHGSCVTLGTSIPGVYDEMVGGLTIVRGKPDGSSPGFFVRDGAGRMFLLKPDDPRQPERASASDALSSAVFHAAGYFTPCNRVIYVARDSFALAPDAELRRTDGRRSPLTEADVDAILDLAQRAPDGRLRFSLSLLVDGEPISPWRYEGVWDDDPNDVFPHQHRRDVRGMYVLSSWLSHIDSRQENTMASFIAGDDGRGYVRHFMIDFSDTLGILHPWEGLARRFGHSGYVDIHHIMEDLFTFGLVDRPWHDAEYGVTGAVLGYYDVEHYSPDGWHPGYRNPAYERMTEADAAWMARILARFSDAHVEALVARARFSDSAVSDELSRVLRGRRDRALRRWLTRLSPLTDPELGGGTLCLEDRAIVGGIATAGERDYRSRAFVGPNLEERSVAAPTARGSRVCVSVAGLVSAGEYLVLDVIAGSTEGPVRVHAYGTGGSLRIVGLERPESHERPLP